MIDDEETFNQVNEKFSAWRAQESKDKKLEDARVLLREAEKNLLEYVLSFPLPASRRKTLEDAVKKDHVTRSKIIDLAMRLDTLPQTKDGYPRNQISEATLTPQKIRRRPARSDDR
jgi:hypothetical protein